MGTNVRPKPPRATESTPPTQWPLPPKPGRASQAQIAARLNNGHRSPRRQDRHHVLPGLDMTKDVIASSLACASVLSPEARRPQLAPSAARMCSIAWFS